MNNMYPMNPLGGYNPYLAQTVPNQFVPTVPQQGPRMEIQRVNGRESALSFAMGPNSSVVLVDNLEPKIWVVTTDSSGYKAVKGFLITPDEEPETATDDPIKALSDRIDKLEKRMDSNVEPDSKSSRKKPAWVSGAQPVDRYGQSSEGSNVGSTTNVE